LFIFFCLILFFFFFFFFFFQAEDGIRDKLVTGVQTCALPISRMKSQSLAASHPRCRYTQLPSSSSCWHRLACPCSTDLWGNSWCCPARSRRSRFMEFWRLPE